MNLVRGGHFAPSLELKRLARGCRRSQAQAWARLPSPCPGLCPQYSLRTLQRGRACHAVCLRCKSQDTLVWRRLRFTGGQSFLLLQVRRVPWRQCCFQTTREKEVRAFWICGSLMRGLFGFKLGAVQQALTRSVVADPLSSTTQQKCTSAWAGKALPPGHAERSHQRGFGRGNAAAIQGSTAGRVCFRQLPPPPLPRA